MPAEPLTKLHIAALRKCDDVVFRHVDRKDTVEAVKRRPEPTPTVPFPQESIVTIEVDAFLRNYSREGINSTPDSWTAFEMLGNYSMDNCGNIATFANALKEGDTIRLQWTAGDSFEKLRDAGWTVDTLTAVIVRKGKVVGSYLLASRVREINDRWRMVRF